MTGLAGRQNKRYFSNQDDVQSSESNSPKQPKNFMEIDDFESDQSKILSINSKTRKPTVRKGSKKLVELQK